MYLHFFLLITFQVWFLLSASNVPSFSSTPQSTFISIMMGRLSLCNVPALDTIWNPEIFEPSGLCVKSVLPIYSSRVLSTFEKYEFSNFLCAALLDVSYEMCNLGMANPEKFNSLTIEELRNDSELNGPKFCDGKGIKLNATVPEIKQLVEVFNDYMMNKSKCESMCIVKGGFHPLCRHIYLIYKEIHQQKPVPIPKDATNSSSIKIKLPIVSPPQNPIYQKHSISNKNAVGNDAPARNGNHKNKLSISAPVSAPAGGDVPIQLNSPLSEDGASHQVTSEKETSTSQKKEVSNSSNVPHAAVSSLGAPLGTHKEEEKSSKPNLLQQVSHPMETHDKTKDNAAGTDAQTKDNPVGTDGQTKGSPEVTDKKTKENPTGADELIKDNPTGADVQLGTNVLSEDNPANIAGQENEDKADIGAEVYTEQPLRDTNTQPKEQIVTDEKQKSQVAEPSDGEAPTNTEASETGDEFLAEETPGVSDDIGVDSDEDTPPVFETGKADMAQNTLGGKMPVSDDDLRDRGYGPDRLAEAEDSHFFAYFMTMIVLCIIGYLVFHNKQKILALAVEGRSRRGTRRRPNTSGYRKLDSNLEEAVTSSCSTYLFVTMLSLLLCEAM